MNDNKFKIETPTEFPYVVTRGNSTVKIFRVNSPKNKAGCYYQVADYTQGPKRKLISKASFGEAKAEAERIVKCLAAGEVHALEMRGPERAAYGRAIELLKGTSTSLELASARYAEAVKILGSGEKVIEAAKFFVARHRVLKPTMAVAELIDEMVGVKMGRNKSDRYVQDLISRLGRFKSDFPGKLVDVDTASIQKWLDGLKLANEKGISAQSYNNYRAVVHGLFAFAETRGYIAKGTNPVELVERQTVRGRAVACFTPSEFADLLSAASRDFLPCLAIGGYAGLRSAEIQRLKWSDIDLQRRHITVTAENAKTAARRNFPICDALAAWLASFSGSEGLIWKSSGDDFVNAQRRTARDAGMKWKGNALRHSYASYRLAETQDATKVAFELGNSPAIVHRHYKELVTSDQATAWFSIRPTAPENITQMPSAVL
jgi:integrase